MSRRTSPEFDMGVMTLANPSTGCCLVTWHETTTTVYMNHVAGDGTSLALLTTEVFPDYLVATHSNHPQVSSHEHVTTLLDGGVDAGLAAYARYLAKAAPPWPRRPAWVTDMVLFQIDSGYYGGFDGIRRRLPEIKANGFNAIYLMPISEGGYAPYDYYVINPRCGTEDELKAMTAEAHRLGIRVLLDLVIEVRRRDSPLVKEHPEYFTRDDAGRILPHTLFENASTECHRGGGGAREREWRRAAHPSRDRCPGDGSGARLVVAARRVVGGARALRTAKGNRGPASRSLAGDAAGAVRIDPPTVTNAVGDIATREMHRHQMLTYPLAAIEEVATALIHDWFLPKDKTDNS